MIPILWGSKLGGPKKETRGVTVTKVVSSEKGKFNKNISEITSKNEQEMVALLIKQTLGPILLIAFRAILLVTEKEIENHKSFGAIR